MERLLSGLKLPFIIVIVILIGLVLIQLSAAYNNYWQGKLAQSNFKKLNP